MATVPSKGAVNDGHMTDRAHLSEAAALSSDTARSEADIALRGTAVNLPHQSSGAHSDADSYDVADQAQRNAIWRNGVSGQTAPSDTPAPASVPAATAPTRAALQPSPPGTTAAAQRVASQPDAVQRVAMQRAAVRRGAMSQSVRRYQYTGPPLELAASPPQELEAAVAAAASLCAQVLAVLTLCLYKLLNLYKPLALPS